MTLERWLRLRSGVANWCPMMTYLGYSERRNRRRAPVAEGHYT